MHETSDAPTLLRCKWYNDMALKTFLAGFKEPRGTTIHCMRPKDMNKLLQLNISEENKNYYQRFNQPHPKQNLTNKPSTSNLNFPKQRNPKLFSLTTHTKQTKIGFTTT